MSTVTHPFKFGDQLVCDADATIIMIATGFMYRRDDADQVECAYWSNAEHRTVWLPSWRLKLALA